MVSKECLGLFLVSKECLGFFLVSKKELVDMFRLDQMLLVEALRGMKA